MAIAEAVTSTTPAKAAVHLLKSISLHQIQETPGNGKVMETRRIQADVVNYVERFTICRAAIDAAGGLWQLVEWPENARSTREP
jgi:hypothetical protein